MLVVLCAVECG